jgi:putative transposase
VTAANVNDVTQLDAVLSAIMVARINPDQRRSKHLCADAGYRGREAHDVIVAHRYIAHVASRRQEHELKQRDPRKKPRRWVVEVAHSWFTRFRKLLVRYEKLHRSYLALNHLAAAIIAFRKVPGSQNIIYG